MTCFKGWNLFLTKHEICIHFKGKRVLSSVRRKLFRSIDACSIYLNKNSPQNCKARPHERTQLWELDVDWAFISHAVDRTKAQITPRREIRGSERLSWKNRRSILSPCPPGCCPSSWRCSLVLRGWGGGVHTHDQDANISFFSSPLVNCTRSWDHVGSVGCSAGNTLFLVTCSLPLRWAVRTCFFFFPPSYCTILALIMSPHQIANFESKVTMSGISCRPEGLLRPSEHQ